MLPPEAGDPVLINPRWKHLLDFIELDLRDRCFFLPLFDSAPRDRQRADYTIEVLRLNHRDLLPLASKQAFDPYKARLVDYVRRRD